MARLRDLARVYTATTGTVALTLGAAVPGYLTFAQAGIANGDVVSYAINEGSISEDGIGTYSSTGPTLTRNPLASTNGGALITLSGNAQVAITALSTDLNLKRGFIDGLILSTAGASATFSVAPGIAANSTGAVTMEITASISKTTSAWAVGSGNGALDTGTIANSTWYHVFEIMRTDGTVVDVLISLSATAPTLPSGYSYFRRIGSMKTDGSAQWVKFIQDGDRFRWAAMTNDINVVNPGTAAVTRTLNVPTGVRVSAEVSAQVLSSNGGSSSPILLTDLLQDDTAVSGQNMNISGYFTNNTAGNTVSSGGSTNAMTNTSAQIRSRIAISAADTQLLINTIGWIDPRGRNG